MPEKTKKRYNLIKFAPPRFISDKDVLHIEVPKVLCLINDHEGTLAYFKDLDNLLSNKVPNHLYISHRYTEVIGLTASLIFDSKIKTYINKWKNRGVKLVPSGEISQNKKVNNFLLAFGLLSELKITSHNFSSQIIDHDYHKKFFVFKMSGSNSFAFQKSNAATGLAKYFRKCLNYNNVDLAEEGVGQLVDAIGEIIGNAEEHSGLDVTKWHVLGCFDKNTSSCGFSIINYGATIYQSLSNPASTSASVLQAVSGVIESNKTILRKVKDKYLLCVDEEPVWNIMALQDGISSKRTESGTDSTRGQGLMDVLEFIHALKADEDTAVIAMISGRSKVVVDYTYPISFAEIEGTSEPRRKIAFNRESDLHKPYDHHKVFYMDNHFPGTIITGMFKINQRYLSTLLEE